MYRVRNLTKQTIVAEHVSAATQLWDRLIGLLAHSKLEESHGLWIERCKSIHTHFMRFSIDVVFISKNGEVLRVFQDVRPFRVTPWIRKASAVLEMPAGTLKNRPIACGDRLSLEAVA